MARRLSRRHSWRRTRTRDCAQGTELVALRHRARQRASCRQLRPQDRRLRDLWPRTRVPSMPYSGEIFELSVLPECQGVGFGRRLFNAARQELAEHGYLSTIVWALADNDKALAFYRRLGGLPIRRAEERFGADMLTRVAFRFAAAPVR